MRNLSALFALALSATTACTDVPGEYEDIEQGGYEGVEEDNDPTIPMDDGKSDIPRYATPQGLPALVAPEVIVSLDGLTVHLFDRETGFSEVYPAGVGILGSNGRSITPTGHFETSDDITDTWYYVARRTNPAYFGGFPFLRINAENSQGAHTYALHGPIDAKLQRGYVSHGCIRMESQDVIDLFWMVKTHASTPVTIQKEVERDARGRKVDIGTNPVLYAPGEDIVYGASVGPR